MARSTKQEDHLNVERTRTSSAWIAIAVAVIFLILLIIFIAQNNRSVKLDFLGASGHVSEALALIVAAVAGALVVLLVGTGRMLQLRLATHRHNKAAKRRDRVASDEASAVPAPERGAQPVETEHQP